MEILWPSLLFGMKISNPHHYGCFWRLVLVCQRLKDLTNSKFLRIKNKHNYKLQGDSKNDKRETNSVTGGRYSRNCKDLSKRTCQAELPEGVNSMEQLWIKPVEFVCTFRIELLWPECQTGRRAYCRSITTLLSTHVLWGKSFLNPHRCRYSTPWLIKPNYKKGKILV